MIERDPLALRVLSALTSGGESAGTLAERLDVARDAVVAILDRQVLDELVTPLDIAGTSVYQLTPKGLDTVGTPQDPGERLVEPEHVVPDVKAVVEESATTAVDVVSDDPFELPPEPATVADAPATKLHRTNVQGERAPEQVNWRHVAYAVVYLLLGLALLLFMTPVLGLLAIIGGVALGGFALRPLLRSRT